MSKGIDHIRFTEGPCDDDDAPDILQNMRKGASLRARKRTADKNLDHIHTRIFRALSEEIGGPDKEWTEAEDDALLAFVGEVLLRLCTGGLFHHDAHQLPRGFIRAVSVNN